MHMLVPMYYCIYMFSYGPYGPEIKHYYYYYPYTRIFSSISLSSHWASKPVYSILSEAYLCVIQIYGHTFFFMKMFFFSESFQGLGYP